jgi:hypothetical protein
LLFDPLAPPAEIEKLTEERETAIVLTCPGTGATPTSIGSTLDPERS